MCHCDQGFFSPPNKGDCSAESKPLVYGETRQDEMKKAEYVFFLLPYVTEEMAKRDVEMEVLVQYSFASQDNSFWESVYMEPPMLLLRKGGDEVYPSLGDGGADFQMELSKPNHAYQLQVPASEVNVGHWKAAIYYPEHQEDVLINITALLHAYCPNNCTGAGHGTCNMDGSCTCIRGYSGSDCAFQANTCLINTYKAEEVDLLGETVTCLKPCVCQDLICKYSDNCQKCAAPFRYRKAYPNPVHSCVLDECTDNQDVYDKDSHLFCEKRCLYPEDGGPRTLESRCISNSLMCISPYTLASNGTCALLEKTGVASGVVAVKHNTGVGKGFVVIIAFTMVVIGILGGVSGLFAYQRYENEKLARSGSIWHDVDAEFSMARF